MRFGQVGEIGVPVNHGKTMQVFRVNVCLCYAVR